MNGIANDLGESDLSTPDEALEMRIFRVMAISVFLAVMVSLWLSPWRIVTGLLLGGVLSLLNYHWLRTSIRAIIQARASGKDISSNGSRFIVRYLVVFAVVLTAYLLNVVSLPATIVGLCSFVVALFAEAFRQSYFSIVNREGIN